MAYEVNTGATNIKFGTTLGIAYRPFGSASAFVQLGYFPGYNELPYTFSLPSAGVWEIQYTTICPSCSGSKFSSIETAVVTVT